MVTTTDLYLKLNEIEELIQSQSENQNQSQNNDNDKEEYLDTADVCEILKVSKRTVQNYVSKGYLKPRKIHGKNYFKRKDIEDAMN